MILFIHRKDLRIEDLTAFDYMHRLNKSSLHLFVLDPFLLKSERRHEHSGRLFLQALRRLQQQYLAHNQHLAIVYGEPAKVIDQILQKHPIEEIVLHRDFTPYAKLRDRAIAVVAEEHRIRITQLVDHLLIDLPQFQDYANRQEAYKIFTPFYRKWNAYMGMYFHPPSVIHLRDLQTVPLAEALIESLTPPFTLEEYEPSQDPFVILEDFVEDYLPTYIIKRDHYAEAGTSSLSYSINTGAISIRTLYARIQNESFGEAWLRQLAWRDFYITQSILDADFFYYERKFDFSELDAQHFAAWCRAETGIPVIDAAMTQLNTTGEMPNRLRMVTAMFLTKNLLVPFTMGEAYFRYKLADYDNTLNRGGWLWSSSLGFDAAPYFRIMNPATQSLTHNPSGSYIRRWLPQLADLPDRLIHEPQKHAIVELKHSRARAIEVYKKITSNPLL